MTNSVERPNSGAERAASPRGAATRRAILAATTELIAEEGWAAITTRMVARRAGVTLGVIHYHFGSKDALLRAAVVGVFSEMIAGPNEALAGRGPLTERLAAVVRSLAALEGQTSLLRVSAEALSLSLRDPELGSWMRNALVEFRGLIAQGLRESAPAQRPRGAAEEHRIDGMAVLLTALLDGLLFHRALDPALDLDAAATALTTLIETEEPHA